MRTSITSPAWRPRNGRSACRSTCIATICFSTARRGDGRDVRLTVEPHRRDVFYTPGRVITLAATRCGCCTRQDIVRRRLPADRKAGTAGRSFVGDTLSRLDRPHRPARRRLRDADRVDPERCCRWETMRLCTPGTVGRRRPGTPDQPVPQFLLLNSQILTRPMRSLSPLATFALIRLSLT